MIGGETMISLRYLRETKGYRQTDVAVIVGCSLASYRLWELGVTKPSGKNMAKLKELFGEENIIAIFGEGV